MTSERDVEARPLASVLRSAVLRGAIFGVALAIVGVLLILLISIEKGLPGQVWKVLGLTALSFFCVGFVATPIAAIEHLRAGKARRVDLAAGAATWAAASVGSIVCVLQLVYATALIARGDLGAAVTSVAKLGRELVNAPGVTLAVASIAGAPFVTTVLTRLRGDPLGRQTRTGAIGSVALALPGHLAILIEAGSVEPWVFVSVLTAAALAGALMPLACVAADAVERRIARRLEDPAR